jgi:hypothetical protein
MPWVGLDGDHIVSDLIGVSDCSRASSRGSPTCCPAAIPTARQRAQATDAGACCATTLVFTNLAALVALAVTIVLMPPNYLERMGRKTLVPVRFGSSPPRAYASKTRSHPGHDLMRACEGSRLVSDPAHRPANGNQIQILVLGSSHGNFPVAG